MPVNRWLGLATGMLIMCVSGTIYLYPNYSNALRSQLNFSIKDADMIGTLMNVGSWVSFLGGFFYDNVGPLMTGLIGTGMTATGYILMWLASKEKIAHSPIAVGCYALIMGQGSGWLYTTGLNTVVQNFDSESRGKIVGALVCCFGLSAGIFTRFHDGFFQSSSGNSSGSISPFILFLAISTSSVGLAGTLCQTVRYAPGQLIPPVNKRRVTTAYVVAIAMALFIAASSFAITFSTVSPFWFAVVMTAMVSLFLVIPIGSGPLFIKKGKHHRGNQYTVLGNDDVDDDESSTLTLKRGQQGGSSINTSHASYFTLKQACQSLDFYLLFFVFLCGIGSGITIVNNLPEIVISCLSRHHEGTTIEHKNLPHNKDTSALLALFSVFNTFGRLAAGYISDSYPTRFPRSFMLVLTSLLMSAVQIYFMSINFYFYAVYFGVCLLGLAYGSFFCLLPTYTSEAFGIPSFGAIWGMIGLAPAIGSEVFGTELAGTLALQHQKKNVVMVVSPSGDLTKHCLGAGCYQTTLFVTAGASFLAAVAAYWLYKRQQRGISNTLFHAKYK